MSRNAGRRFIRRAWTRVATGVRSRCKAVMWSWGRMGRGVRFGRGVFVLHPERVSIGDGASFGDRVEINNSPESEIVIGPGTRIESDCVINVNRTGTLTIGAHSKINRFNVISCNHRIEIGDHVMTAAFCHLLDANHGMAKDEVMRNQAKEFLPTRIGNDVWIGSMCTILAGSTIGDGVVVGANSTTRGTLEPYGVYVGSPVRLVRTRE
ncbi:MAG TPA: DapH/DapD/GlmU-related protein [Candidatus Krumholzibacteria bacterium]|nr:DapH/DapD/GlmU-related protein [Candidatus Krumholzibacteria bacterium]